MIDVAPTTTVSEIVTADPRAAAVFEQFGIDFCCGGRRTFDEACRAAAVDPGAVVSALDVLPSAADREGDAAHWPLPRLIDYIVSTHHAYVRTSMPAIARYLASSTKRTARAIPSSRASARISIGCESTSNSI